MTPRTLRSTFAVSLIAVVAMVGLVGCGSADTASSRSIERRAASGDTEICIRQLFSTFGVYAQFDRNTGPMGNGPFRANGTYCGSNRSQLTVEVYDDDNVGLFTFEATNALVGDIHLRPAPVTFSCPPGGRPTHVVEMRKGPESSAAQWTCGAFVVKVWRPSDTHFVVQLDRPAR